MNKTQFLEVLRRKLQTLPKQEQEAAIAYYEEYFEEAGEQNEQQVLQQLGEPSRVAAQILAESAASQWATPGGKGRNTKKQINSIWYIIVGICAAPVAFPLAIAVAAVLFALLCVIGALIIAMGAVLFALGCPAILLFFVGIWLLFTSTATGLCFVGMGLMSGGLFLLVALPVAKVGSWMLSGIGKMASRSYHKMKGGNA